MKNQIKTQETSKPALRYKEWLQHKRDEAIKRGGKPFRFIGGNMKHHDAFSAQQDASYDDNHTLLPYGEMADEQGQNCITVSKIAKEMLVSSQEINKFLKIHDLIADALDYRVVPMMSAPEFNKPYYFTTPLATAQAVSKGYLIVRKFIKGKRVKSFNLITRLGAQFIRDHYVYKDATKKVDQRREIVQMLLQQGSKIANIIELTQLPRRTVYRYAKHFSNAA